MVTLKTARKAWHPASDDDRRFMLEQLQAILRDPQFANSKRYPALLRYVVERTLDGNAAQIKERIIGIEVFNRPNDYDTNSDTIVRYTAGEVRKRLALYNHEHDDAPIEISLPAGSYVPEFFALVEEEAPPAELAVPEPFLPAEIATEMLVPLPAVHPRRRAAFLRWLVPALLVLAVLVLVFTLRQHRRETALDRFWKPLIAHEGTLLIVPGGVVFSPNLYSGVETAGKGDEYPFVSMQVASAMSRISALMQQKSGTITVLPANTTNLSDLRDRSVVLLGGYNNQWTLRLLQDARLHLGPIGNASIVDRDHPDQPWQRDRSKPYASADDYALVARLHDLTTGSTIVVIAGIGRNGTEAGAQYLTDAHYLAELESRVGHPLGEENIEVVIRVRVVDGRTGAPTLEAVRVW